MKESYMRVNTSVLKRLYGRCVVDSDTGCWEFTGAKNTKGYGNIGIDGRTVSAHRVSYMIANDGAVTPGNHVCHSCDNPSCVNPDHLWEGSHSENMSDRQSKCRAAKGECHGKSKLTTTQVVAIKRMMKTGLSNAEIARKMRVSTTTVRRIKLGITWKEVTA